MATIEPHAFFSSSNLAEQTAFVPAASLDASDPRYIKLLRGLPKQRRHDGLGLSVGLRHTLKALIEYQCHGLGIAYQLREQIGLCLPFLGLLVATPGDSPDAAELSSAPLPASGEGTPKAAESRELVGLASASSWPPGEASAQQKTLEQKGVKLRNEMLSLACHIDKERLVPEVREFTRSKPSLEALQKRLGALKRLARCAQC